MRSRWAGGGLGRGRQKHPAKPWDAFALYWESVVEKVHACLPKYSTTYSVRGTLPTSYTICVLVGQWEVALPCPAAFEQPCKREARVSSDSSDRVRDTYNHSYIHAFHPTARLATWRCEGRTYCVGWNPTPPEVDGAAKRRLQTQPLAIRLTSPAGTLQNASMEESNSHRSIDSHAQKKKRTLIRDQLTRHRNHPLTTSCTNL